VTQPPAPAGEPSFSDLLAALRNSHDRFAAALTPLTDAQVAGPSYASEWSIAQVASHLGSGAEIFAMLVEAGQGGDPAPGIEQMKEIWAVWDAKPAPRQAADAIASNERFLADLAALPAQTRDSWRLDLFGSTQPLTGLLRMRLSEHAVHTWDIVVALDPAATVAADAVDLIVDQLPALANRAGKGAADPVVVHVSTTAPGRDFLLDLGADKATLTPNAATPNAAATLELPAEAFLRLLYGRLDPDHTPAGINPTDVDLDTLRTAFPGF